jgi:signal transduction histidine kinase
MHGIIAMASDLKEMPLPSKAREAIGIISDCADHLLSLVNDVLDFARYHRTRTTHTHTTHDTRSTAHELLTATFRLGSGLSRASWSWSRSHSV